MVTANKFLEQPARGSNVGVWDTPVNANTGIIDNSFGGAASIALTNAPVILSSAQYQCLFITFTGALSGTCPITFPAVGSKYTIQNLTTNTSAFQVTLTTTTASVVIGAPWGEPFDIMTDLSGNIRFCDLGRIGTLWDYIGSSVPAWVTACTIPPFLNCDGTTFSSATYPVLATILGSTTLPDLRGVSRATLNQGTARITSGSSTGGIDGNTNLSRGGAQTVTLSSQNVPLSPATVTDTHQHGVPFQRGSQNGVLVQVGGGTEFTIAISSAATSTSYLNYTSTAGSISVAVGSSSPTNFSNMPPTTIAGITMIRSG